jgi:hypothetical protein
VALDTRFNCCDHAANESQKVNSREEYPDEFRISERKQFKEEFGALVENLPPFPLPIAPEDRVCTEGTINR